MITDTEIVQAQTIPFSPFAEFMNATKGRTYTDMYTGEKLSRFKVWLRENKDKGSLKRVIDHTHAQYVSEDKDGWINGSIVDKQRAGIR